MRVLRCEIAALQTTSPRVPRRVRFVRPLELTGADADPAPRTARSAIHGARRLAQDARGALSDRDPGGSLGKPDVVSVLSLLESRATSS